MPRLYAARFGLQCGLSWESIWWVTCRNACTQRSALNYQNEISECWPFFCWGHLHSTHHFMSFCWVFVNYCEYQLSISSTIC